MGLACGNVLDQDAVMRFYNTLRSFPQGVSKLVVTHLSAEGAKQTRGKADPIGLRWVNNFGRSNWELRTKRNDALGQIRVALYHRKANGFKRQPPIGLQYDFSPVDGAIEASRFDVLSDVGLAAHSSVGDTVIAMLREGEATVQEIRDGTGLQENVIRMQLSRLAKAKIVEKTDPEKRNSPWRLVAA
jgi:hypothetical protein